VNAAVFENVQSHLPELFLLCRGNRKNLYTMTKKETRKRTEHVTPTLTDPRPIFIHFANNIHTHTHTHTERERERERERETESIFMSKMVKGFYEISDFLGLMFLFTYISSCRVGKPKIR